VLIQTAVKKLNLTLILLLLINFLFSQTPNVKQWDKRFGGIGAEYAFALMAMPDGGYLLGGLSQSDSTGDLLQHSHGGYDFWVVKINSNGNKQWGKLYGGTGNEELYCIAKAHDGDYLLGGYTYSDSTGDVSQHTRGERDFWLLKIDSLGNKKWDKRYGGDSWEVMTSISQTTDGGYILGGWSISDSTGDVSHHTHGSYDHWIVKIDSLGNKQWDRLYGGTSIETFCIVKQAPDGGYILGGWSESDSSGDVSHHNFGWADYWLLKTDSLGNKQWDKMFGGTEPEWFQSLVITSDNNYLIGGWSGSDSTGNVSHHSHGSYDYWIVKVDSLGNIIWDKLYGGTGEDDFTYFSPTTDNGFILSGWSWSTAGADKTENNLGNTQSWALKIDSIGNIIWDKTIFAPGSSNYTYAIESNDGCLVIITGTNADTGGYKSQPKWDTTLVNGDYWIVKLCDSLHALPASNFFASATSICNSNCIDFTDQSTNNPIIWQWSFPGAIPDTSSNQNPTQICYQDTGNYSVTLITTNSYGSDTIIYTNLITVFPNPPIPIITINGDTISSSTALGNQWYLDGTIISGAIQDTLVIQQSGWYLVSVTDSNGCSSFSDSVFISPVNISELSSNTQFSIYPIPVTDKLNVTINNKELSVIILYDIASRKIMQQKFTNSVSLNTEELAKGLYIYEVRDRNGLCKKGKIVKD
jgi:PKD repeat protein